MLYGNAKREGKAMENAAWMMIYIGGALILLGLIVTVLRKRR
jgi:hypothetical protein